MTIPARKSSPRLPRVMVSLIPDMHGEMIDFLVQKGFLKEGEHNFSYHFMPYNELYLNSNDFAGSL